MLHLDQAQELAAESLRGFLRGRTRTWRVLLVSDVAARHRLVLWCPKSERNAAEEEIGRRLEAIGGPYWSGDVLPGQSATEFPDGPWQNQAWEEAVEDDELPRQLKFLERHLSKAGWFDAPPEFPWPLAKGKRGGPVICGFYSFKGGVGRSTAIAASALQLAARGDRVVVLDADFDSPGVGSLLRGQDGLVAQVGVVDYLIEAPLQKEEARLFLEDYYHRCPSELHREKGEIVVFPAGTMDKRYVGKLARLNYGPGVSKDGEHPFVSLLRQIRADLDPDWVLVDARAGFGEVSGFLTGGLCHLYVLLGSLASASWDGLKLVLERLGGNRLSRGETQCECLLIAAMVPRMQENVFQSSVRAFTDRARDVLSESYYAEAGASDTAWTVDDLENDSDAPHVPVGLPYDPRLASFADIGDVSEDVLLRSDSPYEDLMRRILRSAGQARGG